jgi:hypothetical protein
MEANSKGNLAQWGAAVNGAKIRRKRNPTYCSVRLRRRLRRPGGRLGNLVIWEARRADEITAGVERSGAPGMGVVCERALKARLVASALYHI